MHNPVSSMQKRSQSLISFAKSLRVSWSVLFVLSLGLTMGWARIVQAESPETAPPQLKDMLTQIDAAANRRDVPGVMQFYGGNFKHSDGLTRGSMEKAISQLWQRYSQLNYRTELKDWKSEGNGVVAETVTYITGTKPSNGTTLKLESTMRSRQRIENQKIVQQEILAERTQQMSGTNPPHIEVQLPEQVRPGQSFSFDVIVKEPLGDSLLLGGALEDTIKPDLYAKPSEFKLDLLPAGGIFKMGKAPTKPQDHWLSAVLVRKDGMTMVTQRLQVVNGSSTSRKSIR
ncbi:nuclear transport factor 2 family protein [Microcoleus sp. FACHB-53]|nr:nuclear transport factor 2 family protein [Microcoleus sp. FACHB-53]